MIFFSLIENETFFPEQYHVTKAEDIEIGSTVVKVSASDPDIGDVLTYSMAFEDSDEFHIDKSTGALILKSALDYETKQSHEIIVEVTDDLHVATATVIVTISDVNDNAPVFQSASYRYVFNHFIWATMQENLSPGFPNNTGADQPAHLRSLISAFVVRFSKSIRC